VCQSAAAAAGLNCAKIYACVASPRADLVRKPKNITQIEAGAVPLAGLTSLQSLKVRSSARARGLVLLSLTCPAREQKAALKNGETVLILGASGGTGSFAVQIAKSFGATVMRACACKLTARPWASG
jgi:NADPH:quinone reductase-like Zn-dependent oxidoreductase